MPGGAWTATPHQRRIEAFSHLRALPRGEERTLTFGEVRKMRRTILLLAVVALVPSSSGTDEGQDSEPTGASGTSTTASSEPSPTAAELTPPTGFTSSDLEGTWVGTVAEPKVDMVWPCRIEIGSCAPGEGCGDMSFATRHYSETGEPMKCTFTLTCEGYQEDLGAFTFAETVRSGGCYPCQLALTPLPSGLALGLEQYCEGPGSGGWMTHGYVQLSLGA
jgi:hypothetical protein